MIHVRGGIEMADEVVQIQTNYPAPTDSILNSIKREFLGISEEYTPFDPNIVLLINSQFGVLNQRGVGPTTPFKITGANETWSQFFENKTYLEMAKELIGIKVKLTFDPPQSSAFIQTLKERATELEWRLSIFDDEWTDPDEKKEED